VDRRARPPEQPGQPTRPEIRALACLADPLLLAEPKRRLMSFDPVVREHREAYLGLLPRSARERLELVAAPGHEARGVGVE
jgi:hypothetical protein